MGLFDWLTRKNQKVEVAHDRIWLTKDAKLAGIQREVAQAVANPAGSCAVIVVAHFKDCLEQLQTAIAGIDRDRVLVTSADALAEQTPTDPFVIREPLLDLRLTVVCVDQTPVGLAASDSRSILILVGERHPLLSHDDAIMAFARSLPCRCRLVYHVSLEDALLRLFSGEWVEGVLRSLGMKEDETIESRMVVHRIQTASKKIARIAIGDEPADSAEEWLKRNCP